jgi:hypothetical protein
MRKKEAKQAAGFTEIIDCFRVSRRPEGPERTYEIIVGRHRLEVVRSADRTNLYLLRRNDLNYRVQYVATALKDLSESKN